MATTPIPTTILPTTLPPTTAAPTTAAPAERDYMSDRTIYCDPIELFLFVEGVSLNRVFTSSSIEVFLVMGGSGIEGIVLSDSSIEVTLQLKFDGVILQASKSNWAMWSKIGELDFTKDHSNEAGERPLDWKGLVYDVLKLGSSVVYYGANGVTVLTPKDVHMGMTTVSRVGVKCKGAVVGTESVHYFIDVKDRLCKLITGTLEIIDYSEYLSNLTNPKMSLDVETGLIYICDGSVGYVYSTQTGSLGEGPVNITGLGSQSGTLFVVIGSVTSIPPTTLLVTTLSPTTVITTSTPTTTPPDISYPALYIRTDIYDFGTRKPKTIQSVEVGTDLVNELYVMVEFRNSNKEAFTTTPWILVNPNGIAYCPCYGVEFRVYIRSLIYEYLEIDYIKISGSVHEFNYLNQVE